MNYDYFTPKFIEGQYLQLKNSYESPVEIKPEDEPALAAMIDGRKKETSLSATGHFYRFRITNGKVMLLLFFRAGTKAAHGIAFTMAMVGNDQLKVLSVSGYKS